MLSIFLSYSSKDKDFIKIIINNIKLLPEHHNLWHYQQTDINNISMKKIIDKLREVDLFVLFISDNSLNSPFVQQELLEAIRLMEKGNIKEICPIIIDNSINPNLDNRIPQFIKNNCIYKTETPINAAQIMGISLHLLQLRYNHPH
ncbi:MAG: toll/interleukin-1 receptor domain-containing protein [Bacillota bacterium]